MATKSTSYHHGDLRAELLEQAVKLVEVQGTDALSMRKLGDAIGVSRSAIYHHFTNKNDLLSAMAEQGFLNFKDQVDAILNQPISEIEKLRGYTNSYLHFALDNKAIYDLMFGKAIWANKVSTDQLTKTAYKGFDDHVRLVSHWQKSGLISANEDTLRLAQVSWATLHGISRLFIDGVYVDSQHIDELSNTIVNMLTR